MCRGLALLLDADPAMTVVGSVHDEGDEVIEAVHRISRCHHRRRSSFVASGRSNPEIAAAFYLGEATVKSHLASAQTKPRARNRVQVGVVAARRARGRVVNL